MAKTENSNKNIEVVKSHRKANIAVIIVVSIAVLILIAVAVLSLVKVDPVSDLEEPEFYYFYDHNASLPQVASDDGSQSKIRTALGDMKFTVMSAILQWNWDYSYNFKRNSAGDKIEVGMTDFKNIVASDSEYMIEYVYEQIPVVDGKLDYSKAHSLEVDGETVYFDRIKMLIGDTAGTVGTISFYPYIFARYDNQSDIEGLSSETYKVTGINVRAESTNAYATLKELAASFI